MRNFVFALLAANVLYFAWSYWGADDNPMLTEVGVREAPANAIPPPPPPCATLGPFQDELLAGSAETQLAAAGLHAQRRDGTAEISDGWWVYVTSADATAQKRALDALRRAGQRDAFSMPDDPDFRVSVGVFSDEQRAEEQATRVRGLNLAPVVEERHKEQSQIWFDLPGMSREALEDGRLDNMDLPLLDLRIETCPAP
jgi:hypothetical protein